MKMNLPAPKRSNFLLLTVEHVMVFSTLIFMSYYIITAKIDQFG